MKYFNVTIFILNLFSIGMVLACDITVPGQYLYIESQKSFNQKSIKSNCTQNDTDDVSSFLLKNSGVLKSEHIIRSLTLDSANRVSFSPEEITVVHIDEKIYELLKEMYSSNNLYPFDLKLFNFEGMAESTYQKINVKCDNCLSPGLKSITISIGNKTFWGQALFKKRIKGLKLIQRVEVSQEISLEHTKEEFFFTEYPENFLVSNFEAPFISTRQLNPGEFLQKNQVTEKYLVRPQTRAKIIFISGGIRVSAEGMPLQQGTLGKTVQFRLDRNNKVITAKVIGENQASVEL